MAIKRIASSYVYYYNHKYSKVSLKLFFFEDNKLKKILARYQGFCDFKNRKFGEYKRL